jgi:hypothetical protein
MSERKRGLIAMLLVLLIGVAVMAIFVPMLGNAVNAEHDGPNAPRALPSDICMVGGKPLMPELDYIGYGSPPGLVLKYVNTDGDLVLLVEDELIGIYEGDFCPLP